MSVVLERCRRVRSRPRSAKKDRPPHISLGLLSPASAQHNSAHSILRPGAHVEVLARPRKAKAKGARPPRQIASIFPGARTPQTACLCSCNNTTLAVLRLKTVVGCDDAEGQGLVAEKRDLRGHWCLALAPVNVEDRQTEIYARRNRERRHDLCRRYKIS
ncbi:hypothetical protein EK21DRAFT_92054 [Setomelanomma holmii]|uniref:Uncharacterized protein n=1 Tax=Setomelanomma holmii TaxID=210430 RepID=A0A9P4LHH3_9PLEO|nr:hypothetical protein EK21DRAFT_92054 [Setomelanomma holmii]